MAHGAAPFMQSSLMAQLRAVARARQQQMQNPLGDQTSNPTMMGGVSQIDRQTSFQPTPQGSGATNKPGGIRGLAGNYFSQGGLSNALAGLSEVPRGANFGTAFLASAGGANKAYSEGVDKQALYDQQVKLAGMRSTPMEQRLQMLIALGNDPSTPEGRAAIQTALFPQAAGAEAKATKAADAAQGPNLYGTKTGVAPPNFQGPLPQGEIHAEQLPPNVSATDYPTYQKGLAAAAGRRAGAPPIPRVTPQAEQDVQAISKTLGMDPNVVRTNLKLGTWKVVKTGDTASTVYDANGNQVTTYTPQYGRVTTPLPGQDPLSEENLAKSIPASMSVSNLMTLRSHPGLSHATLMLIDQRVHQLQGGQ